MNTININSTDLSLIFWRKILDNSFLKQRTMQKDFFKKIDSLDELRLQSSYNTGSISSTTSWLLFSITLFFKPKIIFEVGSFIGRSTFSMAFAADTNTLSVEEEGQYIRAVVSYADGQGYSHEVNVSLPESTNWVQQGNDIEIDNSYL